MPTAITSWPGTIEIQKGPNSHYQVDAQVYNAAGQVRTGVIDVADTAANTRPSVAMDANGDFVVAWEAYDGSNYDGLYAIKAQRYNLAGTAQGSVLTVTPGTSQTTSPKVAMDSAGDFVITYNGPDANNYGVFAQLYNSSGGVVKSTFGVNTVTTGDQTAQSVAMDAAGDFVIAWENGGNGIVTQRYNAAGTALV
jgi:hypothetical protein